jgi:hypothetical protein
MAISKQEKTRILGLAQVERLQSEGMARIERGSEVSDITAKLLDLSQETSDALVSEMAMLAHAGISSAQLGSAAAALSSVNDQIATATNAFALAARIAQLGEEKLTFPFVAGKTASLLDLLKTLKKSVTDTVDRAGNVQGIASLLTAFDEANAALEEVKKKAEKLAG